MRKHDTPQSGELYCDTRFYGVERWYYGKPKDADMRLPDEILKSVCFICVKAIDEHGQEYNHFIGTAFFAIYDHFAGELFQPALPTLAPLYYVYLVTARHIFDGAKAEGYTEFYVRINTHDKGSKVIPLPDEWVYPENKAVDVAILPFNPDTREFDYFCIPTATFVYRFSLPPNTVKIGIGDELITVGLFLKRSGYGRNIPIVRTGIISAMPDEPFAQVTEDEQEPFLYYNAYLAEIKSIAGLSGSPVFIMFPPGRFPPDPMRPNKPYDEDIWHIMLLGMIRGPWNVDEDEIAHDSTERELQEFNAGIAEVTPMYEVRNLMDGRQLVAQRTERIKEYRRKHAATLDSAKPPTKDKEEGVITQEGFEEALRRASRKTSSQPESESDET